MQTEEILVKIIFNNQMLFCGIFGALGGVVHSLDVRSGITLPILINKIIISLSAGLLLFFATYDMSAITPATRIAAAIVSGFYGSSLFRYLAKIYTKADPHEFTKARPLDDATDVENKPPDGDGGSCGKTR